MWLVMRGALSAGVKRVHKSYYLPSMTAIATVVYENEAQLMTANDASRHRDEMARQLQGAEALAGTYPYTLERSAKGYRVNYFLHALVNPAARERFRADEEAAYEVAGLSEEERDLIRRRDWRGLIHYGVIFFVLEKLGAVIGLSNIDIYAAMRGQTVEEFQKTRNSAVLYSVASPFSSPAEPSR